MHFVLPSRCNAVPSANACVRSDAIDPRRDRSYNPPMSKYTQCGWAGDPRGLRKDGGRGGQHGGPMRLTDMTVDQLSSKHTIEKLTRT